MRADARHGARVDMPPTDIGPYTLTELALRTLIRETIDDIDGVVSLRTAIDYSTSDGWNSRGLPRRVVCRISAVETTPDLPGLAEQVRSAVRGACARELDLPAIPVDVHIEDLHAH